MPDRLPIPGVSNSLHEKIPFEKLKVCPLCANLNAAHNESCFSCGWTGHFDSNTELIEDSLVEMLATCPALLQVVAIERKKRKNLFKSLLRTIKAKQQSRKAA